MIRFVVLGLFSGSALALSPEAKEFMAIAGKLEPVHCEKRKLRREIALERRLGELEPRLSSSADPEDLPAISRQQREAFYRCE